MLYTSDSHYNLFCGETMSNKQYGLQKEREVKKLVEQEGAMVVRCRGSFGAYDLICFFEGYCKLISVKATKQKYFACGVELQKLNNVKLPDYCKGELWVYLSPRADRERKGWIKMDVKEGDSK